MSAARASRCSAGQRGMTVVELMIAMVILGVVIAAAFSVAFSIMNSYREHRRAVGVERSARGAMAVLTEAVRNASPGVPKGQITDVVGCETSWHGIHVENSSTGPDALDVVYASGGVVTSLRAAINQDSTQLLLEDGSALKPGDQLMVTDFDKGHLLAVQTVVQAGPDWVVTLAGAPSSICAGLPAFTYEPRAAVVRAQKARFSVAAPNGLPILFMDPDGPDPAGPLPPEAVAEGVEDLQIAIGVDRDGDGRIGEDLPAAGDDNDWIYDHEDDSDALDTGAQPYRAIRLTVIARSLEETSLVPVSQRPPAEDRPAAAAPDVFRRRSLSATIEIRNLEGSP